MPLPRSTARLLAAALVLVLAPLAVLAAPDLATAAGHPKHHTHPTKHVKHGHKKSDKNDPRRHRGLFVDNLMKAAQAGPAFKRIGGRAQPLWITDYYQKPAQARQATHAYVMRAEKAKKTPLVTVYNIPDRDCGMYSSQDDQITDGFYRKWVTQVANGVRGSKPIVILEPDAIPFIGNPACTGKGNRLGLLKYATRKLTSAGAWVYLDAGHSGWKTPAQMAPLLKKAGVGIARGFATNVANSRSTTAENRYAHAIIKALGKRGVHGVHYVMDTSRNGKGKAARPQNGDVCNPLTAHLGAPPQLQFKGSFDGNLWVKLPGESDGPCNGGPSSGEFFPTGACRLMGNPNSYYDSGSQRCRK